MFKKGTLLLGRALILLTLCALLATQRVWQEPLVASLRAFHNSISRGIETVSDKEILSPSPERHQSNVLGDRRYEDVEGAVIDSRPRLKALSCDHRPGNSDLFENSGSYVKNIINHNEVSSELICPPLNKERYSALQRGKSSTLLPRYFFALDLHQSVHIITQLLGSVMEAIRFLGPENCTLSIVEGRSTDGTYEILRSLKPQLDDLGLHYQLQCNEDDPLEEGHDRISTLASFRNYALQNLTSNPHMFDPSTTIVFLNDVALCTEDILELVYQRVVLGADMTCAMDWINDGGMFYDVWISRMMNGETFFEVPQSGSWEFSSNLFWNDVKTRDRFDRGRPFQVFACWNGAIAMTAKPFLNNEIEFRSQYQGECILGEPVHLCKDLWKLGHGRVAVIPSVNVAYQMQEANLAKEKHGTVSSWVAKEDIAEGKIEWKEKPPQLVKCVTPWTRPAWEAWDQGLPTVVS